MVIRVMFTGEQSAVNDIGSDVLPALSLTARWLRKVAGPEAHLRHQGHGLKKYRYHIHPGKFRSLYINLN